MRQTWQAFAMELGGPRLKELREAAGFPGRAGRAEFAKRVGIEPRTLEGWESARGHVPEGKRKLVQKVLDEGVGSASLQAMPNIEIVSVLADRLARYEEMEREYRKLLEQLRDTQRESYDVNSGNDDPRNNEGDDPQGRPAQAHPAPGPKL